MGNYITISNFTIQNAYAAERTYYVTGVIYKNNLVINSKYGALVDGSDATSLIINNTFYGCRTGIGQNAGTPLVKNNIVVNSTLRGMAALPNTANCNLVYSNVAAYFAGSVPGANDVNLDPIFVDPSNGNFHLQKSSPAINAGANLSSSGVATDILGIARPQGSAYDIGAYEYYDVPVGLTALDPDPTGDTTPTFTGTSSTPNGTISSVSYSVDEGEWSTDGVAGTTSYSITIPSALAEGAHTIKVRATDSNGYTTDSTLYGTDSFTVDTSGPTAGTISVNSGDTATGDRDVTLTLSATDAFSTVTYMMLSESADFDGASWVAYATSKAFELTASNGTKTVYVKFKDAAGNVSEVVNDTIVLDTTAPAGSIAINAGATLTNDRTLALTLAATDDLSTVAEMMIAEDAAFTGVSYEAFSTSRTYELTSVGDAVKTVYVKFKDALGNESTPYSAEIELDTTGPSAPAITKLGLIPNIPNKNTLFYYFTSQVPQIKGNAEVGSTVSFKNLLGSKTYTTTADADGKFTIVISNPALSRGDVSLSYYATDTAGNKSSTRTLNLVIGEENFPGTQDEEESEEETPQPTPTPEVTITETPTATPTPTVTPAPTKYVAQVEETETGRFLSEFRVKLVDGNGNPLSGVEVTLHSEEQKATTDILGIATFNRVAIATHNLTFAYNGKEVSREITVQAPSARAKEVELETVTIVVKENKGTWVAGLAIGIILLWLVFRRKNTK